MQWLNDFGDYCYRCWCFVTTGRSLAIIFGLLFALIAISLFIASRTRWGQSKALTKCIVLSILAHVWLLMYALGERPILPQGSLKGVEQHMSVAIESVTPASAATTDVDPEQLPSEAGEQPVWAQPVPLALLPQPKLLAEVDESLDMQLEKLLPALEPLPLPNLPPPAELLVDENESEAASADLATHDLLADLPQPEGATQVEAADEPPNPTEVTATQDIASSPSAVTPRPPEAQSAVSTLTSAGSNAPREYALRQAPNRLQLSAAFGADADSEAAVEAGLQWLVSAQSPSGAWVAKDFGAGTETWALGEQRYGTGGRADTGVSGLALLAFLSAGHTHLSGEHRATVENGLRFLLQAQMPSGDLSGPKQVGSQWGVMNAKMYCHGIASLALAEAYAMTHDIALRDALLLAAQYSINAQDPRGGGWRYRPRDPGDLSQFGWQAMALKSVQRSGISVPQLVQQRMQTFLDSCATGKSGGLARYRPGEGHPSETMTAEALACRLLLDYEVTAAAQREATDAIMAHRPGIGQDNVYFWYYATLALFQLQDENWRVWNQALKTRLLTTQIPNYGMQPGSWDPDQLWGGYGGRVYSTAMSCLCLEVYYRYLPLYQRPTTVAAPPPAYLRR